MKIRCLAASAADGFPWCSTPGKDVVVDRMTIARDVGFFLVFFASTAGVVELPLVFASTEWQSRPLAAGGDQ